ncbi:glycosyltransferase [Methanohalobium evestigatum]|uniref:glycosyltransferase n=1 Tax=Methanohalobium evestigatum TaxID=2322 RepID=UPI0012F69F8F|nr:glycosyltransferase [Methanohalobium evestigatum]
MKIAFIVNAFPKLSETFILNQITGLLDNGHDVKIFASSHPNENIVHEDIKKYNLMSRVHYLNLPKNFIFRFLKGITLIVFNLYKNPVLIIRSLNIFKFGKFALSLKMLYITINFLNKNEFDIIHCHFGPNGILGVYLKEIGVNAKYITSFHGYDVNKYPKKYGCNVYNKLFEEGDLFTVNTEYTKNQVKKLGCNENKLVTLPVGLNIRNYSFLKRSYDSRKPIKLLSVGRLVEKKGHEYAIEAMYEVLKRYQNVEYLIVGDGPLYNYLQKLISKLNIENHVKLLGSIDDKSLFQVYQKSHIFVFPSVTSKEGDKEGQGLVLQEAQAVGLPVISTFHNGIPEGVIDGISGFLVPEKDVDALADKMEYLIENPFLWSHMGYNGRKFVEKNYDINKLNKQLEIIYLRAISAY